MDEDFEFEEKDELENGIDNEKHWKSLGIASAVISVICFIIIMAILILTPSNNSGLKQESYTLSEVLSKKIIQGNRFNGTWISGHEFIYQSPDKNIMIYDCLQSQSKPITTKLNTTEIEIIHYEISPSRQYLLLMTTIPNNNGATSQRMANLECDPSIEYYIYDLTNENMINLEEKFLSMLKQITPTTTTNNKQGQQIHDHKTESLNRKYYNEESNKKTSTITKTMMSTTIETSFHSCLIQSTQWNPLGNILLIMHYNDIYWMDIDQLKEEEKIVSRISFKSLIRLTNDGSIIDSIYNGYNDYVYRDLIFEKPTSIWWSHKNDNNDGHYFLCYLQINNSRLPLTTISNYAEDADERIFYRYSNINNSIGVVNLWIIEIDGNWNSSSKSSSSSKSEEYENQFSKAILIKPPDKLNQREFYVVHVDWINNDQIVVLWTLRNQKQSILGSCEANKNWKCDELVTLKNWLHMNHVPHSILAAKRIDTATSNGIQSEILEKNQELFFCGQTPENGVKTLHQLYSFNVKTKVINSYLNMAELNQQRHYQIIELLGYNSKSKWIFFVGKSLNQSSTTLNDSNENQNEISEQDMRMNLFIFSIDFNTVHCITCQLVECYQRKQQKSSSTKNHSDICIDFRNPIKFNNKNNNNVDDDEDGKNQDEESCVFQRIYISPSAEYALITCLIGIIPKIYLIKFTSIDKLDVNDYAHPLDLIENITLFEDNSDLESRVETKMMPNVENFVFTRENEDLVKYLRIKLLTPPDFNNEDIAKYPLIFEMYPPRNEFYHIAKSSSNGGRNNRVFHTESYPNIEWAVHMVTEHEFIYAWLDGQFYQDSNHSIHEISYEELIDDYSTLIDFIQTNMTFINPLQTCLIGNNIGAYFVLNSLATSSIQCGIAISPFIDWTTINSFLAEQYLNLDRLRSNDLQYLLKMTLNHKLLVDKNLLIIHGTSNEMYPVRNTMKLLKSLTFDEQVRFRKETSAVNDEYEINITNHHSMELYVDEGNSFDRIIEHFFIKIEFFLFQWIIV